MRLIEGGITGDDAPFILHEVVVLILAAEGAHREGRAEAVAQHACEEDAGDSGQLLRAERSDSEASATHERVRAHHGGEAELCREHVARLATARLLNALAPEADALLPTHLLGVRRVQRDVALLHTVSKFAVK